MFQAFPDLLICLITANTYKRRCAYSSVWIERLPPKKKAGRSNRPRRAKKVRNTS